MITEEQAKQRLAQIAMMPSVVMVGVDSKQGGVSIGMELDERSAKTLIGVLRKLTESDDTAVTVH